jgi:hypothetical protein
MEILNTKEEFNAFIAQNPVCIVEVSFDTNMKILQRLASKPAFECVKFAAITMMAAAKQHPSLILFKDGKELEQIPIPSSPPAQMAICLKARELVQ